MVKYINAECYKAFRRKYFYLFLAAILALAGAWAATALDVALLRKPFGVYLLLSGVSLVWPGRKKGGSPS